MNKLIFLFGALVYLVLTHAAISGVISSNHKWDKTEVRVCWAVKGTVYHDCDGNSHKLANTNHALSTSELQKYKDLIRDTVNSEFQKDTVGFSFVGWKECPANIEIGFVADALISINVERDRKANFGGGSNVGKCKADAAKYLGIPSIGFSMYVGKWNKPVRFEDRIKLNSLHEFGHLAGLIHEDYIPESPEWIREQKAEIITGYNPISVMSYEFLDQIDLYGLSFTTKQLNQRRLLGVWKNDPPSVRINEAGEIVVKPKLSSGDIRSLQTLYGLIAEEALR